MLLIGSSGVGKTHLAIALGLAACGQGRKVRFFRVTERITLLMESKEEKQLLRFRKQIKQLDLKGKSFRLRDARRRQRRVTGPSWTHHPRSNQPPRSRFTPSPALHFSTGVHSMGAAASDIRPGVFMASTNQLDAGAKIVSRLTRGRTHRSCAALPGALEIGVIPSVLSGSIGPQQQVRGRVRQRRRAGGQVRDWRSRRDLQ